MLGSRRLGTMLLQVLAVLFVPLSCRPSGGEEEASVATNVAVHTAPIVTRDMRRFITAYGYVQPEPARNGRSPAGAVLVPLGIGIVTEIRTVEGARVSRGDVLLRLDTRMADVAVQKGEREVAFAERVVDRQRQLLPWEATSLRALQEAEQRLNDARSALAAARTARSYLNVVAPITGTVTGLSVRVGQAVDASSVLGWVVDLGRMVVVADVPVVEAGGFGVGARVLLGSDSSGRRGVVSIIGKNVDPQTGTVRVTASLPAGSGLTPGQFTDLQILAASHRSVLVVPDEAVVSRSGQGSWIAVVANDSAIRTPVIVGIREAGLAEVSAPGLAPGMSVATTEAYGLPAQTKVRVARR